MNWKSKTKNTIINKIGHNELIIKCKQLNTFTSHQLKISTKLKQLFGNTKIRTLEYNLKILKQDLKALSKKVSYQSKLNERNPSVKMFHQPQKCISQIYRPKYRNQKDPHW